METSCIYFFLILENTVFRYISLLGKKIQFLLDKGDGTTKDKVSVKDLH